MKFLLNKKDIVALNQEFDQGKLNNEASLDFALDYARRTENWIKALGYITRAILIDHVFEEGNKRTTALLINAYAEYEGHKINNDKLLLMIKTILKKNITSIAKIEEMIKDVVR